MNQQRNDNNDHIYWKLHRLNDIQNFSKVYDVFGVISYSEHITDSYDCNFKAQDQYRLKIRSYDADKCQSHQKVDADITIYASLDVIPPNVLVPGKVLRAHRFNVKRLRNNNKVYLSGRVSMHVNIIVYELNDDHYKILYQSKLPITFGDKDQKILDGLKPVVKQILSVDNQGYIPPENDDFFASWPEENRQIPSQQASQQVVDISAVGDVPERSQIPVQNNVVANDREEPIRNDSRVDNRNQPDETELLSSPRRIDEMRYIFKETDVKMFKHINKSGYYTIACQVVSVYSNEKYALIRVWDGTRTRLGIRTEPINAAAVFRFGNKKLEALIDEDDLMYNIYCFEHTCDDALQLRKGDLIMCHSVHVHMANRTNASNYILTLHGNVDSKLIKLNSDIAIYKTLKYQVEDAQRSLSSNKIADAITSPAPDPEPTDEQENIPSSADRTERVVVGQPSTSGILTSTPKKRVSRTPRGYNDNLRIGDFNDTRGLETVTFADDVEENERRQNNQTLNEFLDNFNSQQPVDELSTVNNADNQERVDAAPTSSVEDVIVVVSQSYLNDAELSRISLRNRNINRNGSARKTTDNSNSLKAKVTPKKQKRNSAPITRRNPPRLSKARKTVNDTVV